MLVLTVYAEDEAERYRVLVAYGTSQKADRLYVGEFAISPADGAAFKASGLSFPTKFNLGKSAELPYNSTWFDVPPAAPFGQVPMLGVLHARLVKRAAAAARAAAR
ncbi:MAG TPA: hypothetical protein VMK82_10185 [Steroidobacteraceae bacterium]|nr:hypothetical protein [Steroidobacteraceae bacterium]